MTDLRITRLDADDAAAYDAWYDVHAAARRHGLGDVVTVLEREELRPILQDPSIRTWSAAYAGHLAETREVVATGIVRTPLLDNLESADLSVQVLPGHRRRGHGTAMLAHLEQVALERGRTVCTIEVDHPYASGPDGAGEPGPEFARARGYELAIGEVQRRLALPVPDEVLDRLADEAAPHHAAYALRSWVGPVPDDLAQGWAELTATLAVEAPTGTLDVEAEVVSVEAVREAEAATARQGRTTYNTVALDPAGAVVAYTDLAVSSHDPGRAHQWGTLVRRDHRGHRLGLAVKVANLRLLQAARADLHSLVTYNAEVNEVMVGVNDRLGFVPVARIAEFQKRL